MGRLIDMTGGTYGRLTVIGLVDRLDSGECVWHCECSCGGKTKVTGRYLRTGKIKSCGCLRKENASKRMSAYHNKKKDVEDGADRVLAGGELGGLFRERPDDELRGGAGGQHEDDSKHPEDCVGGEEDGAVQRRDTSEQVRSDTQHQAAVAGHHNTGLYEVVS